MASNEQVLGGIVEEMPTPQPHAIEQAQEETKTTASKAQVDDFGRAFDPAIHATDSDGNPRINKDGTFRKKRGSQKSSQVNLPGTTPGDVSTKIGKSIAESIFQIGQLIGGEEWAPIRNEEYGVDERRQMHEAWTAYAEEKEIEDFPPGVAVTIAMLGYIVPRFAMPKTKTRAEKFKDWCTLKYVQWKGRKQKPRAPEE